jgi:hypothetical protein
LQLSTIVMCVGEGEGGGGGVLRKLRVGVVPNPAAAAVDVHNVCVERAKGCLGRQPLAHAKKESSPLIFGAVLCHQPNDSRVTVLCSEMKRSVTIPA